MKQVYLMVYDLGGGHRATANALQEVIAERNLPWQVHIVELFHEIFDNDAPHNVYNNIVLKKKWAKIINEPLLVPAFKLEIRLRSRNWRSLLEKYWQTHPPDLVVSLLPYVNKILQDSLQTTFPQTPLVTSLTDFADCPPHFWIEPECPYVICPTEHAVLQAKQLGCTPEQIFATSGLTIHPRFYQEIKSDCHKERAKLGLNPDLPTGLVMCGGYGSKVMLDIAESLERSSLNLQLIFLCGHNQELAATLERTQKRLPRLVKTFTTEVPYYMRLADFFIGKPGPGSISEALAMQLPVITESNAYTLFQEKYNAQWVVDNQVGMVVKDFRDVDRAVAELLQGDKLSCYRAKAASLNNQGIFEVVDILQKISDRPRSNKKPIESIKELI